MLSQNRGRCIHLAGSGCLGEAKGRAEDPPVHVPYLRTTHQYNIHEHPVVAYMRILADLTHIVDGRTGQLSLH